MVDGLLSIQKRSKEVKEGQGAESRSKTRRKKAAYQYTLHSKTYTPTQVSGHMPCFSPPLVFEAVRECCWTQNCPLIINIGSAVDAELASDPYFVNSSIQESSVCFEDNLPAPHEYLCNIHNAEPHVGGCVLDAGGPCGGAQETRAYGQV